jgi:SAM-dependent methyltransferase
VSLAWGIAGGAVAAAFAVPMLQATSKREGRTFSAILEQLVNFHHEHWQLLVVLFGAVLIGFAGRRGWLREWQMRAGHFAMMFSLTLGALLVVQIRHDTAEASSTSRDFYGVLKVFEHNPEDPDLHYTTLVHGVTSHGLQFASPPQSTWPTTYYGETSGIGVAIESLPPLPRRHIGLVGLGTGTVASYGRIGDRVRIYEIDPHVERLARSQFSYLSGTQAKVEVVIGDARLSMERELAAGQSQQFDVLALDAFSSDAIPVHLLTREAFSTYLGHLKPGGIIAVHTSNRYLDLQPVVENLARVFNLKAVTISDNPPANKWWLFRTTWILVTNNPALLASATVQSALARDPPSSRRVAVWTDDHASVSQILK